MLRSKVVVIDHPLIQHKLTLMRKKDTSTGEFRALLGEISLLMGYEVTRDLPLTTQIIETPLVTMSAPVLEGKKLAFVSILRSGQGLLDGMLQLVPSARIGHIGLYRNPDTLEIVEYYLKLPPVITERDVLLLDPMLATGNSAVVAISRLKQAHAKNIKFVCLVSCPEGIKRVQEAHPDVCIYTAAIDEGLNEHSYIVPGLGDAGDRMFGTK